MTRTPALILSTLALVSASVAHAEEAVAAHANYAHPAVAVARMAATAGVNPNTFIVQPPATTTWTVMPEAKVVAAVDTAPAK